MRMDKENGINQGKFETFINSIMRKLRESKYFTQKELIYIEETIISKYNGYDSIQMILEECFLHSEPFNGNAYIKTRKLSNILDNHIPTLEQKYIKFIDRCPECGYILPTKPLGKSISEIISYNEGMLDMKKEIKYFLEETMFDVDDFVITDSRLTKINKILY